MLIDANCYPTVWNFTGDVCRHVALFAAQFSEKWTHH
jgi:hypothetical protein